MGSERQRRLLEHGRHSADHVCLNYGWLIEYLDVRREVPPASQLQPRRLGRRPWLERRLGSGHNPGQQFPLLARREQQFIVTRSSDGLGHRRELVYRIGPPGRCGFLHGGRFCEIGQLFDRSRYPGLSWQSLRWSLFRATLTTETARRGHPIASSSSLSATDSSPSPRSARDAHLSPRYTVAGRNGTRWSPGFSRKALANTG